MRKIDKFDEGADQATYLVVYPRGVKFNLFTGWNVNLDALEMWTNWPSFGRYFQTWIPLLRLIPGVSKLWDSLLK